MDIPGIPRIPTDNLYKFVALSGILMLLVGFGAPAFMVLRSRSSNREFIAELGVRTARLTTTTAQVERATEILRRGGSKAVADAMIDSARATRESLTVTEPLTQARKQAREDELGFYRFFGMVGFLIAILGSILAAWGFIEWYHKLQKPLDEIVRRQAEELKNILQS